VGKGEAPGSISKMSVSSYQVEKIAIMASELFLYLSMPLPLARELFA